MIVPDVAAAVRDLTAARRIARDERRTMRRQRQGFEQFRKTVAETDPTGVGGTADHLGASSPGWTTSATLAADDRCRRVRAAFEELVVPHVDDEATSVRAALAAELSTEVAVALAAEGGGNQFTEPLQRAILEHTDQRLAESRVMIQALASELDSLDDTIEVLKAVAETLPTVDSSVRLLCEDAELWTRRQRAASLEADLDAAIRTRQSTLESVTATEVKAGIGHDTVVEYLFGDRDTTYPALDALVRGVRECRRRRAALDDALEDG